MPLLPLPNILSHQFTHQNIYYPQYYVNHTNASHRFKKIKITHTKLFFNRRKINRKTHQNNIKLIEKLIEKYKSNFLCQNPSFTLTSSSLFVSVLKLFLSLPIVVYKAIYIPKCIQAIQSQLFQYCLGWDDWVYHPPSIQELYRDIEEQTHLKNFNNQVIPMF